MAKMKIQFLNPSITVTDIKQAVKVLKSGWILMGPASFEFEKNLSRYMRTKHAVLTNSCTSALFQSLLLAGIKPGDEVITTPLSYVATPNAIIHAGGTPVFVDVEPETGLIDSNKIEKAITNKTKVILPVHLYGQMADMKSISKIAKKHKLAVIEDAAHAIESERDGIRPAQLGLTACFSFHVAKNITAGQGGAIVTNNSRGDKLARLLRRDGIKNIGVKRRMVVLGYKQLMTDFQAALLDSQLSRIDSQWEKRKQIYENYAKVFLNVKGLSFPKLVPNSKHAYHMFVIQVSPDKRDKIIEFLYENGIQTSIHYDPIHLEPFYKKTLGYKRGDFPITEKFGLSTITLPLYPKLNKRQQKYVIDKVKESLNNV